MVNVPVAQILAFVNTFINAIPPIQFRTAKDTNRDFIKACIHRFIPQHESRIGLINYLITRIDHSVINDICLDDLYHSEMDLIQSDIETDLSNDYMNVRSIVENKYKGIITWVDAIYAGIWLLNNQIELVTARMDRENALEAFANIDHNYIDSDSSDTYSDYENSYIYNDNNHIATNSDLDYFII